MKLITDRTQADVLLGTEKGRYSVADLNRVEQAVAELSLLAKELDIYPGADTKTDWELPGIFSASKWPTKEQMTRYLGNVYLLCDSMEIAAGLPLSMEQFTWEGANQIENALMLAYDRIQNILQTFYYSGEIFAGEENEL